jgi:hypothetical protein
MSKKLFMVFGLSLLLLIMAAPVSADLTQSLYESADGINPPGPNNLVTERPPAILLPEDVVDGVLRVWEWDLALRPQYPQLIYPYDWISDFVWFFEDGGQQYAQLFSDPFTRDEVDRFMSITPFNDVVETAPPTVYFAAPNTYYIYSDAPEPIPVPPSMILLGSGLLGLITFRRFHG